MNSEEVRRHVSQAYAHALGRSQGGGAGCCGPPAGPVGPEGGTCGGVEPAGVAARTAGYTSELGAFREAGRSSFGCGNPLALAGVRAGQTLVDLGSGAGLDLLIAAEKVGPSGLVIGVDMTDAMIEAARANAARAGFTNVEVRRGLIEDLPIEVGSVDWVISNCVVNLSPEKPRVFAEIQRVLRPGGRFSISDIVAEELPEPLRKLAAAYSACISGAIPEKEYVAGLRAAGLEDVQVGERLVYTVEQIRGLVASDLEPFGESLEEGALAESFAGLEGKVASVRLSGRKPDRP